MTPWRTICCPVDFSPPSRTALAQAAELSRRLGTELVVLHVDDRPERRPGAGETLASPAALERAPLEIERQLGEWCREAEAIAGRRVAWALVAGAPEREIVRFAAERAADAVVMGTHGREERDRLVFGSVAQAVVREARCTVVVVRDRPPGPAAEERGKP